jgi:serine/threonine protein kinase
MDFGAGHYQCAARQTWQPLPPGTAPYRSPEAWLFERRADPSQGDRYLASPADDVYALGVTAYRLVTGEYPRGPRLQVNAEGTWHLLEAPPPSPRELNPRVDPQLSALVLRMLSLSPEARGTAEELAEALEAQATHAAKGAGAALPATQPPPPRLGSRKPRGAWRILSPWALAGVFLALWVWQALHVPSRSASVQEPVASTPAPADEAAAGLGASGAEAPLPPEKEPSKQKVVAQDEPPKPFPGQLTPDARGRCPGRKQLPINGGCWVEVPVKDAEECEENGYVFFKARCFAPALDTRRKPPPTSAPSDSR